MAALRCRSCGDPVEKFRSSKKNTMIDPTPYCRECFLEKTEGKIPNVTGPDKNTPMGGPSGAPEPSPWQENAIRDMET